MTERTPNRTATSRPRVGTASKIVVTGAVAGLSLGLVGAMTAAQQASSVAAQPPATIPTEPVPTTSAAGAESVVVVRRVVVATDPGQAAATQPPRVEARIEPSRHSPPPLRASDRWNP